MKIAIAGSHEVDGLWPTVGPMFQRAVDKAGDDLSTGDLWQMCRSGNAFLGIVFNDDGILMAFAVRFEKWSKGSVLRILSVAGEAMTTWQAEIFAFLKAMAKANGADRLISEGRLGWQKIYPEAKPLRCTYEVEID